jgi:hypothetical protein
MASNDRCPTTELLKSDCAHCRPMARPAFTAIFDGHCVTCNSGFEAGERIRETATGNYEHARHG